MLEKHCWYYEKGDSMEEGVLEVAYKPSGEAESYTLYDSIEGGANMVAVAPNLLQALQMAEKALRDYEGHKAH